MLIEDIIAAIINIIIYALSVCIIYNLRRKSRAEWSVSIFIMYIFHFILVAINVFIQVFSGIITSLHDAGITLIIYSISNCIQAFICYGVFTIIATLCSKICKKEKMPEEADNRQDMPYFESVKQGIQQLFKTIFVALLAVLGVIHTLASFFLPLVIVFFILNLIFKWF